MSWLSDVSEVGARIAHTDGTHGTILEIQAKGRTATVAWDDGITETVDEDFLHFYDN